MTNQEMLISYINKLTEDEISSLLEAASLMLETKEPAEKPPCPYFSDNRSLLRDPLWARLSKTAVSLQNMRAHFRSDYKYRHGKFTLPGIRLEGDGQGHPAWQCH